MPWRGTLLGTCLPDEWIKLRTPMQHQGSRLMRKQGSGFGFRRRRRRRCRHGLADERWPQLGSQDGGTALRATGGYNTMGEMKVEESRTCNSSGHKWKTRGLHRFIFTTTQSDSCIQAATGYWASRHTAKLRAQSRKT